MKKWKKVSLYKILVYFFKKWCPIKKKKKKKKTEQSTHGPRKSKEKKGQGSVPIGTY